MDKPNQDKYKAVVVEHAKFYDGRDLSYHIQLANNFSIAKKNKIAREWGSVKQYV